MSRKPIQKGFSDAELRAYLVGQTTPGLARTIELALDRDDALNERLMALDDPGLPVREAYDNLLTKAPSDQLTVAYGAAMAATGAADGSSGGRAPDDRATIWSVLGAVTLAALAFGAGFLVAARLANQQSVTAEPPAVEIPAMVPAPAPVSEPAEEPTPQPAPEPDAPLVSQAPPRPGWLTVVADYVRLLTPETFVTGAQSPEQVAIGLASAEAVAGAEIGRIAAAAGLSLQRVELLRLNGNPLVQLAFLDADGATVAICILRRPKMPDGLSEDVASPLKRDQVHDLNIVHWNLNTHGYLVIGGQPVEEIETIAARVAAEH